MPSHDKFDADLLAATSVATSGEGSPELPEILRRIEALLQRSDTDLMTSTSLRMAFSSSPHTKNTQTVANNLLRTSSDRLSIHVDECQYISGNDPFDLYAGLWDAYLADNGQFPVEGTFPLQDMQWKHTRAFMAFSTKEVSWLLVDISLSQQPAAMGATRPASITLYCSQAGVAAKAAQWVGVKLNLAKKRSGSPLKDVEIDVKQWQEVVVPNTSALGLLGAAITAAFIARHESLETLNGNVDEITPKLRIACAQELEQRCAQKCGDRSDGKSLYARIQTILNSTQESVAGEATFNESPKQTATAVSLPKSKRLMKGKWTPSEEQQLISMRAEGRTWEQSR